jgi:sialate O-acetylesterase
MKKFSFLLFICCLLNKIVEAQFNQAWRGKKCAVVITYDDAIDQHLDNAIPVLDSLGLKATFYVTAYAASCQKRLNEWKKIAVDGHELGNHTLYHPCIGGPGREWVQPQYDLSKYSVPRIVDEIRMTNLFLQSMDGKSKRTYAYTCADTLAGGVSYTNEIKNDFVAVRNVRSEMHRIDQVKLNDVDCYMVNHHSAEQMTEWVKKAVETNSLLVILFHGVGGGNGLDVSLDNHRRFLSYLKENEKDIWIAPMLEVAEHIKEWQNRWRIN